MRSVCIPTRQCRRRRQVRLPSRRPRLRAPQAGGPPRAYEDGYPDLHGCADGNHDRHDHAYPNSNVHADDHANTDRNLHAVGHAYLNAAAAAEGHARSGDCRTAAADPVGSASPVMLFGGLGALGCAGLLGIALIVSKRR